MPSTASPPIVSESEIGGPGHFLHTLAGWHGLGSRPSAPDGGVESLHGMVEARQEFCGETVPDAPEFVRDADCQGGVPPGERLGKSVELGFEGGEASEPLV